MCEEVALGGDGEVDADAGEAVGCAGVVEVGVGVVGSAVAFGDGAVFDFGFGGRGRDGGVDAVEGEHF